MLVGLVQPSYKKAHENNDMDELERILERNGVIGRFERSFIPADQQPGKKGSSALDSFR